MTKLRTFRAIDVSMVAGSARALRPVVIRYASAAAATTARASTNSATSFSTDFIVSPTSIGAQRLATALRLQTGPATPFAVAQPFKAAITVVYVEGPTEPRYSRVRSGARIS